MIKQMNMIIILHYLEQLSLSLTWLPIALLLQELFDIMASINRFSVVYKREKKSGYWSKQEATFFDIRDAMLWERHVKELGCKNTEIVPLFD